MVLNSKGSFQPVDRSPFHVTHLMFADDLLLFANAESAACIKEVLGATFELNGLQVNCHKSNRYF